MRTAQSGAIAAPAVKQPFLRQVNPLLKILLCCLLTSLALGLHQIAALAVLVTGLLGGLLFSLRLGSKFWGTGAIALLVFFGFSLALRDVQIAVISTLRLVAILLPMPLLASTTAPGDLVRALQTARLPGFLVLSLMLIWRFVPLIQQEAQRILEANQLRGVDLKRQPKDWFSGLVLPLIFRLVSYADEVTIGLETRGYDPTAPRSMGYPLQWRQRDSWLVVGVLGLLLLVGYLEWMA